ncbi:MAG: hypothetical protein AAF420_07525 [Pseudomonadota bacterium]
MKNLTKLGLAALLSLSLIACGGGGGGGGSDNSGGSTANTSPATATEANRGQLSAGASEASKEAINITSAPRRDAGVSSSQVNQAQSVVDHTLSQLSSTASRSLLTDTVIQGECGGNAVVTIDDSSQQISRIVYNSYCLVSQPENIIATGTVTFSYSGNTETLTYTNFMITQGSESYTVNMTITCNTQTFECTVMSNFTGGNGVSYSLSDMSVSGNSSSGYNITATVGDPVEGTFTITATNITVCANGNIATGMVQITDSTGAVVISVTYPDCDTMIVTFNGVATPYSQNTYEPL